MDHPTQLRICHQRIGNDRGWRWCDLRAYAWCHDCGYYVCQIHTVARHDAHHTEPIHR